MVTIDVECWALRQRLIWFRWKPLEGILAMLGGLADDLAGVLDGDEQTGGPMKAEIQHLLQQVVPSLLSSSGAFEKRSYQYLSADGLSRNAVPPR